MQPTLSAHHRTSGCLLTCSEFTGATNVILDLAGAIRAINKEYHTVGLEEWDIHEGEPRYPQMLADIPPATPETLAELRSALRSLV